MAAPRKILICEDEDAIREFEVINLQRSGYEVVDVSCGEDAIRVFDEQGDSFSVAILDIMMPGIDGFAVCKHIREKQHPGHHHAFRQKPGDGQGERPDAGRR